MHPRILRLQQVKARTGLARSTIYLYIAQGKFPAQICLGAGARSVGWIETEIDDWINRQIDSTRSTER